MRGSSTWSLNYKNTTKKSNLASNAKIS